MISLSLECIDRKYVSIWLGFGYIVLSDKDAAVFGMIYEMYVDDQARGFRSKRPNS